MDTPQLPALRSYQSWIANETLEDYSLRYAARSFRRWTPLTGPAHCLGLLLGLIRRKVPTHFLDNVGLSND